MRLLIVDADPRPAECFDALVARGDQLTRCVDVREAEAELERAFFDVVIADSALVTAVAGRHFLVSCAERGSSVVLLLADHTHLAELAGFEHLVEDFAVKPLTPAILEARLDLVSRRRSASRGERVLLGAVPDLVFWLSRNGTYLRCHAPDPDQLAAPAAVLVGKNIDDFLPAELARHLRRRILEALERGSVDLEYGLEVPAGRRRFHGRIVRAGADHVVLMARDVTAEREAADALDASRARIETLIGALPDSVFRFTGAGMVLDYIPRTRAPFLAYADRIPGRNLLDLAEMVPGVPLEMMQNIVALGQKVLASGEIQSAELEFSVDGNRVAVELRLMRFGPDEVMGISRDVTQLRRAAEEQRALAHIKAAFANRIVEVQEEERRHLARELHDSIGQRLLVHRLDTEWLSKHSGGSGTTRMADSLGRGLDETLEMVRALAHGLRPPVLDDFGIGCALEGLANQMARRTGIHLECVIDELEGGISNESAVAVYRIAQEALTNAVRHADCSAIALYLRHRDGRLELHVSDNGQGIPEERLGDPRSFGLVGMRERAERLGGRVHIRRAEGGGTLVMAEFPTVTASDACA